MANVFLRTEPGDTGERGGGSRLATPEQVDVRANRILRAVPAEDLERLMKASHLEHLEVGERLYGPGEHLSEVFFPLDSVVSVVTTMNDGASVEVTTVGNEGLAGVPVFLGAEAGPNEAFSQVPGQVVRTPAAAFMWEVERVPKLRETVARYTQALFGLVTQSVACNRLHSIGSGLRAGC